MALTIAKIFFLVALLGVILNTLGCVVFPNIVLWTTGIVVFLIGAVGALVSCRKKENSRY